MKHNMTMRKNNKMALANLFGTIATIGARYIGAQHSACADRLRAENLQLKNQLAHIQQARVSNQVLEGDLKIELIKLKILKEQRKLGITDAPFVANDYQDPGNIREEERKH